MAVFEYQAIAESGKSVKGIIDADSPVAARRKLREQALHPTAVVETFGKQGLEVKGISLSRVGQRDIALMTRQLAVLLRAGMPLVESLSALLDQTTSARLRKIIYDVRDKVNEGSSLADALAGHPRIFSELYVNMVGAGESSGALEQVLFRLMDILERQVRLKKRVVAALVYPFCMMGIGMCVIAFLMTWVVPKIVLILEKQEKELPLITKILIATCDFMADRWWVIALVIVGSVVVWRAWIARPDGRRRWDNLKLNVPLFGPLYVKMNCARFARTLGTMLESGLTVMKALDVVKSVLQNRVLTDAMDDVKRGVRRGRDLSAPLSEVGVFPPMLLHMVELGQRSGELESMLLTVAETYDEDVELTVDALVSLLEPVMIVVMAVFVGFLVLAILLPILRMSSGI